MKMNQSWKRILGPIVSVALHVVLILLLLHTLGFTPKPKPEDVKFDFTTLPELTLDEVFPLDPPEVPDDTSLSPDPLTAEDLATIAPPDDVSADISDDSISMLDNLSPLTIQGVGADLKSLGTLTSRYGDRARRNGLLGSYFNRVDFTGETVMRIDETLNHQWEAASPWPGKVEDDRFSIIWTGRVVPPRSGEYTFYLQSDDGARLWIDGELVLNQFVERTRQEDAVTVRLLVGKSYDIKYAYCEVFGVAVSRLEWSCEAAGIPRQLIPTEHLWADGASTRQMMAWNEEARAGAGAKFPNRAVMRNPAMIEGQPFSHIVNYEQLTPGALARLDLAEMSGDLLAFQRSNKLPAFATLPPVPPGFAPDQRAAHAAHPDDVSITLE
jgi:hypothetical protein